MPTSIEELERVHLRFIKVTDDVKLTEILSKILPNILNIFFEPDLSNADLSNKKIIAIEQILSHLMMRVKNSKQCSPPWTALVDILNQSLYLTDFKNQTVKRHASSRIFEFLFESVDRLPADLDQGYIHVLLQTQANEDLKYIDKCRLFLFLLQKLSQYVKGLKLEQLDAIIQPIFTDELKQSFLQMSLYYVLNNIANETLQMSMRQAFTQAINEMSQKFKCELKETQTQFVQSYEDAIIRVLSIQSLFKPDEVLPIMIIASQSSINKTRESAELSVRSLFSSIDTKDSQLSGKLFSLVFTETYIYKDFSEREDQEIQQFPWQIQAKLIEYLMKFECSASQHPLTQKLIFQCFFSLLADRLEKIGLQFIKHMIRFNDLATDHTTVQYLRSTLLKILHEGNFSEESRSTALLLLGDMAMRNYEAVNDDIDLAISTFDKLKARVHVLEGEGQQSIRNDSIASNYIESLNRLRDCYEEKLKDQNKRNLIVSFVLNSLNKESGTDTNSEIIYLLFLYLIRLDSGQFNSSVLLHSIILKDHEDIKIKKEAYRQLDNFNQQMSEAENSESNQNHSKRILRPFLKDIEIFLHKNHMNYIYDGSDYQLEEILRFNNSHFTKDFIEKLFEITSFAIRFFKDEEKNKDQMMDLGDQLDIQEKVEKLLMMNLNQNFSLIKSDFSAPLNLIFDYLKVAPSGSVGAISSIGLNFIYNLSQGAVNLAQRVLSLKIIIKIIKISRLTKSRKDQLFMKLTENLPQQERLSTLTHESKLSTLYNLTILLLFDEDNEQSKEMISSIIEQLTNGSQSLSPNVMEQIKFMTACMKKIGQVIDLSHASFLKPEYSIFIDYLIGLVKRAELDPVFKKYILNNIAGIMKKSDKEINIQKADQLIQDMIDVDNADIQEPLGKAQAKIHFYAEKLTEHTSLMLEKVFQTGCSLNTKRNSAIYLYQVVDLYGKLQKAIQDMFLNIQRVFLKFLFDRKAYMQDLSSKALSKIYHLGTPDVRNLLVENLSKTLSGEKSTQEHQEKDENQELLLEFKDNTSTEQREKLKTYKDLCNIAVELGHRELIYQFLEVHRHLSHYQDIKNAAKGLSSIIMLDERLRGDLLKIAPKILLLSYDHNNEVKETMKELWSSLIDIEKEETIINSRWDEIFKEAFEGLNSKEYRRRQSSALALSDLLNQRSWLQIKAKFREVFLTTLGLMDDQKDSVKLAAFQLAKTMKRLTLKLGNIYTNGNVIELEEVLQIVIPMILDDCMKSTMKAVKFFSVDLLFDLVKTSQNQNMMNKLKLPNKYEKQLVFNYNSEQKMKEIMNKFLDRIVIEVLANLSQMNKAVETINYFEQLAIEHGMSTNSKSKNKIGISEGELNDLRVKYTKESAWGEILKICRDQMTQDTFNKILNNLLEFMFKGHDQITKSSAISFIDDIILENKLYLITPQNSRKIATKLVEIYSLNSVNASLSMKESIQNMYASCLGLQMKILKEYPKTVAQIIESLIKLPRDLDIIVCINIYEISKNLPEDMLKTQNLLKDAYPLIFINRFQLNDHRLKNLCRKAHSFLMEYIPNLVENSREQIFSLIKDWLDSSSYDNRVAASQAMQEICSKLGEEDLKESSVVRDVIDKMHSLIQGKYFNNKEQVVEGFMTLIKIGNFTSSSEFTNNYIRNTCYKQIEKNLTSKLGFKNQMIHSMNQILETTKVVQKEVKDMMFEMLSRDLRACLQKVSEKAAMIESMDEFEEKREEEKQTLESALLELASIPYLIPDVLHDQGQQSLLSELCKQYYQSTNWLVRNSILKCYKEILRQKKVNDYTLSFIDHLLQNVADLGEKYDTNLSQIADITLIFSEGPFKQITIGHERIRSNIGKIVLLLIEKGAEDLIKNVDLIKRNIE